MAELAVPIIALGSLYILSAQENKKEAFSKEKQQIHNKKSNTKRLDNQHNFNNQEVNNYKHREPFQNQQQTLSGPLQNNEKIKLMNGQEVDKNEFNHNNMKPFFGAKIRGATKDLNITESILDNKQGYGSQSFNKIEQAPLFRPDENTNTIRYSK